MCVCVCVRVCVSFPNLWGSLSEQWFSPKKFDSYCVTSSTIHYSTVWPALLPGKGSHRWKTKTSQLPLSRLAHFLSTSLCSCSLIVFFFVLPSWQCSACAMPQRLIKPKTYYYIVWWVEQPLSVYPPAAAQRWYDSAPCGLFTFM